MTISEILNKVEKVDTETQYWFIRTDYGSQFDGFISGKYVAIGWDYITLNDLKISTEENIKARIAKKEDFDVSSFSGKIKSTTSYNKIKTFIDLKKDDIVVIPSRNSDRLAFGRIEDDKTYEEVEAKSFIKRRKVEWFEIKQMEDLNPIFFQVKTNQHTISNINRFAPHIDRVIGNLFKKGDKTHYVLNIDTTDDINFDELTLLMDNIKVLVKNLNKEFQFDENLEEFYVKINLQSKGTLELIKNGKSLAVLAYLIFLSSCNSLDQEKDKRIQGFIDSNRKTLESTTKVIDTMKVNTEEFTKIFKNGN